MDIRLLFISLIGIFLINYYVLPIVLKLPHLFSIFTKTKSAILMGLAAIFIVILASLITLIINQYILLKYDITYLRTVFFILIAAFFGFSVIITINKILPSVYKSHGIFFTYLMIICAELSLVISILNIESGFNTEIKLSDVIIQGLVTGFAFTIVLILMTGILERLEFAEIHTKLKGIPISILVACLLALALFGFSEIRI